MSCRPLARLLLPFMVIVLAACRPPSAALLPGAVGGERGQEIRESVLASEGDWRFSGRVAIARGADGGNARLTWQQSGDRFDIQLVAPITGQRWRLHGDANGATIEGLADGVRTGADPEALLFDATGWTLPVRDLPYWLRGVRAPGMADMHWDAEGQPLRLAQGGWTIEYRDWHAGSPPLPRRVFARRAEASVRLVIEGWQ